MDEIAKLNCKIILILIPPQDKSYNSNKDIININTMIKHHSRTHKNIQIIDPHKFIKEWHLAIDGIHLSRRGKIYLSKKIAELITYEKRNSTISTQANQQKQRQPETQIQTEHVIPSNMQKFQVNKSLSYRQQKEQDTKKQTQNNQSQQLYNHKKTNPSIYHKKYEEWPALDNIRRHQEKLWERSIKRMGTEQQKKFTWGMTNPNWGYQNYSRTGLI